MKNKTPGCCGVSCKLPEKMPDRMLALYGAAFLEFCAFIFFGIAMLGAMMATGAGEDRATLPPPPANVPFLILAGLIGSISSAIVVLAARILAKQYGLRALCLALVQPALVVVVLRGRYPGWFNTVLLWSSLAPVVISLLSGYLSRKPENHIPSEPNGD